MKFRLSTMLLLFLAVCISLSWAADRWARRAITGTWYYPTNDIRLTGYTSTLEINRDGSFTKIQTYRIGWKAFSGEYMLQDDGCVLFHITSITEPSPTIVDGAIVDEHVSKVLDASFYCRCAVDLTGFLVIDARDSFSYPNDECDIEWETHARESNTFVRRIELAR